MSRLGTFLKEAREAQGLSIEKVTQETRLSEDIVKQLEEGGFAALPSYNHVKNFVKNYAEYLGLDIEEVNAMLAEECTRSDFTRDTAIVFSNEPLQEIAASEPVPVMKYIIPAVVIILVIFAGTKLFFALKGNNKVETAPVAEQVQPQAPASAAPQQEDTTFNTVDPKTVEKTIEEVTAAEQTGEGTTPAAEGEAKPGEANKMVVQDGVIRPDKTAIEADKLKEEKDKKALPTGNVAILNFADVCWVHVKSDTGEELDFIASRGNKREIAFKKYFVLDVGNAAVASVTFNGKVISGLGGYKQPAKGLKFEPNETGSLKYSIVK